MLPLLRRLGCSENRVLDNVQTLLKTFKYGVERRNAGPWGCRARDARRSPARPCPCPPPLLALLRAMSCSSRSSGWLCLLFSPRSWQSGTMPCKQPLPRRYAGCPRFCFPQKKRESLFWPILFACLIVPPKCTAALWRLGGAGGRHAQRRRRLVRGQGRRAPRGALRRSLGGLLREKRGARPPSCLASRTPLPHP